MKKGLTTAFVFLISIVSLWAIDSLSVSLHLDLEKPVIEGNLDYSGNNQYDRAEHKLTNPLRVIVTDKAAKPIAGLQVQFSIITQPSDDSKPIIHTPIATTNAEGIAETEFTLGKKPGEYQILCKLHKIESSELEIFTVHARKKNWVFFLIIGLLGGLGLFLLGMDMMSTGLQKSAGDKMRSILSTLTYNRFVAFGVGAFVTMVIQSSSATSVMLVSFVNAKLMRFRQTLGVILGAAIGTTITAQLIAFKLTDYSLLMIGLGFIVYFFFKKDKIKNIGESVLGFGVLFFGMHIMSESMYPLRSYSPFIDALIALENPILGIAAGAVFTALIQSSSAFVGIMIVLASQGLLTLEASIPLVFGANIGTSITAILASINANNEARKVAAAHTLFKIIGALLVIWWIPSFTDLVLKISPKTILGSSEAASILPRQVANAHTVFNIFLTLVILPFTNSFATLINKFLFKDKGIQKVETKLLLDKKVLKTPSLAVSLAKQESLRMSKFVFDMLENIYTAFITKDKCLVDKVEDLEIKVDNMHALIKDYLLTITRGNIGKSAVEESYLTLFVIKELEQIGDIIHTNLSPRALKWINSKAHFSEEGKKELSNFHKLLKTQLKNTLKAYENINLKKAKKVKDTTKDVRKLLMDMEKQHFKRLQKDIEETVKSSKTHLEVMGMMNAINVHITNIARYLLNNEPNGKS